MAMADERAKSGPLTFEIPTSSSLLAEQIVLDRSMLETCLTQPAVVLGATAVAVVG